MSDFVHDPEPQVVVVNGPEGSTTIEQDTSDFAHPDPVEEDADESLVGENSDDTVSSSEGTPVLKLGE